MPLDYGSMSQQYVVHRDDKKTWRILDLLHPDMKGRGPEDDIPDDSPAVTVLTEGQFIELVKEATKLGFLQNASWENTEREKQELERKIEELKQTPQTPPRSESFELKKTGIDAILKVVGLGAIEHEIK